MLFVIRSANGHSAPLSVEKGRELVLGRDSEACHFVVLDPGVSQKHCKLSIEGGWAWIDDLDSSNGTFVNGRKVRISPVEDGDVIRIGTSEIKVSDDQAEAYAF